MGSAAGPMNSMAAIGRRHVQRFLRWVCLMSSFRGVNRDRLTACIVSLLFRQDAGIARDGKSLDRPLATDREIAMNANIGTIDRGLRIVVGLILIGLSLSGVIGLWGWIGIVPLATGIFRFCPLYALLGIKTCKRC